MPLRLIRGCAEAFIERLLVGLPQTDTFELIPGGHVGEDYLVALLEPAKNLNGVHGTLAQLHLSAAGFPGRRIEPEEPDGALLLAEGRAADVQDVVQTLQLDGAVDAEVGSRTARQFAFERDVHGYCAVDGGRIDTNHLAGNDAAARVYCGDLADGEVLGLRFRN